MQTDLTELLALALRHARDIRTPTPIPRVAVGVAHAPTEPMPGVHEPAVCLVLQGAKEVLVADQRLRYDPACYFVASVEVPASGRITEASRERPFVSVAMSLDPEVLEGLIPEAAAPSRGEPPAQGFGVSPVTPELTDAWLRLIRLLDRPQDIAVLAPLFEREILYRLLQGPHAGLLRQIARADSRLSRVRRAIAWIRRHYDQRLSIGDLAELAGMSPAAFHRHFKAVTAMSPLKFQKSLRLQHARRLLLASVDAARAAYAVGYESPSQFSRDYARLFGAPPARDARRLRAVPTAVSELAATHVGYSAPAELASPA